MAFIKTGLDLEKQLVEESDSRNFNLDQLGAALGYAPKHQRFIVPTLSTKDQQRVNSCVCESTVVQKEPDENVLLSASDIGAELVRRGQMNSNGTSIQAALKVTLERGIAEESVVPSTHSSFSAFSSPSLLTQATAENAGIHKSKSYWRTSTIETMQEQFDSLRLAQIGMNWCYEYNELKAPYLIDKPGRVVGGHDVNPIGYDLDYHGMRVLIVQTSYGTAWGDSGRFYVPFEAFNSIFITGAYFVLDIEKDLASWLSLHAHRPIKELNSAKIYLIEGDQKRHIKDEAVFWLLGLNFKDVLVDKDNMLGLITEGPELTIADIPPTEVQNFKETLMALRSAMDLKRIFQPYYPDLFPN